MAEIISRIEWYKDKGFAAVEVFSDATKINYNKGSSSTANTCEITLTNPINQVTSDGKTVHKYVDNSGKIKFQEEDYIKVYIRQSSTTGTIDTTSTSPDLVFAGDVSEIETQVGKGKTTIKLKCVDRTFVLLNKLWSYDYSDTAPNIIQHIIRATTGDMSSSVRFDASGNGISTAYGGGYGIDARFTSGGGFIEDTRPDTGATAFPSITLALKAKPIYDWLLQLSQIDNCNDISDIDAGTNPIKRNMVFYVDQLNRLHWFYPRDGSVSTLSAHLIAGVDSGISVNNTGSFPTNGTVYIGEEEIEYTGKDATTLGTTTVTRGVNNTTDATHSSGAEITSTLDIIEGDNSNGIEVLGSKLTKKTFDVVNFVIYNAGNDLNNVGILYYYFDSASSFSKDKMTYKPWIDVAKIMKTSEENEGNITVNADGTVTIDVSSGTATWKVNEVLQTYSDATDYNSKFIIEARRRAKVRSEKLIAQTGNVRWKGTITIRGQRLNPGVLCRYTSNSIGIQKTFLRIKMIQNNIDKMGWSATLTVEEDQQEGTVKA